MQPAAEQPRSEPPARRVLAFLLAPVGAGLVCVSYGAADSLAEGEPTRWGRLLPMAAIFTVIAVPVSWVLAPFPVAWLRRRSLLAWPSLAAVGAVLGACTFAVIWLASVIAGNPGGPFTAALWLLALGACCGIGSASAYWAIDILPDQWKRPEST